MSKEYYSRPHTSSCNWLGALVREAEDRAAAIAPLLEPIREEQRPWSSLLDVLESDRQRALETTQRVAA